MQHSTGNRPPQSARAWLTWVLTAGVITLLALTAASRASSNLPSLEDLQWLENLLLTERGDLLAKTEDPNLVFMEAPGGAIFTLDRAAVGRIVAHGAFLAEHTSAADLFLPVLPADVRMVIEGLRDAGLWKEGAISMIGMAEVDRYSDTVREKARRRVHDEYDPLIAELQDAMAELMRGDPAAVEGLITGSPATNEPNLDGSLAWHYVRDGDCAGSDVAQTDGPEPDSALATGTTIAVCWDADKYRNAYAPEEAFCTYKTVTIDGCIRGENTGFMYEASRN